LPIVLILKAGFACVMMSNEPFALSPVPPHSAPPSESEYEAICATVMESARGRWFLNEYARRNRHADTQLVVEAIGRLEAAVRGEQAQPVDDLRSALSDMAEAIARAKADIAAIKSNGGHQGRIIEASEELDSIVEATEHTTSTILAAAEHVQDIAWTMREQDINARYCDELDSEATAIYTACSFQDLTGQRTHRVIQVMRYIEGRINVLVDVWGDLAKTAPAKAKSQPIPNGHDSIEGEAQASSERAPDDVGANTLDANNLGADDSGAAERQAPAPPPAEDSRAAYLELEPLIPSRARDRVDTPHAEFLSTGAAVTDVDFGSTKILVETIAHAPDPLDPAHAEPEQIGEREQVPTVSMIEAGDAQASAPLQIETMNGDEVPTVSMLEAAMQRLATESGVGLPPRMILAAAAARAEEPPVTAPIEAEATREEIVAGIDAEAVALLDGSESSPDAERGATILVLPAAVGPVAAPPLGESTVEQASSEAAPRAENANWISPLEIAPLVFDPGTGRANEPQQSAPPAAIGPLDPLATAATPSIVPSALAQPAAGVGSAVTQWEEADGALPITEGEPTGAAALRVQPAAVTGPVREPPIPEPADQSERDLAELLFEPAREPATPTASPNPLPVVQFENGSSAEAAPKSSVQVASKPGALAAVSLQSVELGGPNGALTAAAPIGMSTETPAAAALPSSAAPRGPTQQSPQRGVARPAANDPLAAILALSEEEKIALFS